LVSGTRNAVASSPVPHAVNYVLIIHLSQPRFIRCDRSLGQACPRKQQLTFAELTLSADKKNVIKRRGPYRHPIFAEIIFRELFVSHDQAAISELTKHFYNPVPLEVIAFVATAVQCALHDWLEGAQAKTTTEFSADQWSATYDSHVKVLRQLQVAKPREVEAWCTSIYKNCWSSTSAAIVREEDPATAMKLSQEEMDDFDDVHSTV
ncbi:hypothetical protein BKA62DRAFT_779534, partial [Auriculariales sp. MPI-PUGE-AT-0066]